MTERGPGERFKVQTFCQSETGMEEYICLREVCVVCISKCRVQRTCLWAFPYGMCRINLRLCTPPSCYVSVCTGSDGGVYSHTEAFI